MHRIALYALLGLLLASPSCAEFGDQLFALYADDADQGWSLRGAVAFDGGLLAVGGSKATSPTSYQPAGYVFDIASGSQVAKLTSPALEQYNLAGFYLDIEDQRVLVGLPYGGTVSGAALLFDAQTGDQIGRFEPDDSSREGLGRGVAIEGGIGVIGRNYSLTVVDLSSEVTTTITSTTAASIGGPAIDVEAGVALVGSKRDRTAGYEAGAAHLIDLTTGVELQRLIADDPSDFAWFGEAIDLEGGLALVGAPEHLDEQSYRTGAAYLFDAATGEQLAKFVAGDQQHRDRFGSSVALSDGLAFVAAPDHNGEFYDAGAIYIFDVATGVQLRKLTLAASVQDSHLGAWIAAGEGRLLAVTHQTGDQPFPDLGSVRVFDVAPAQEPGDFNNDGVVDAADYTVWRDGVGADYNAAGLPLWKHAYGNYLAQSNLSIPEPGTSLLLIAGVSSWVGWRPRLPPPA